MNDPLIVHCAPDPAGLRDAARNPPATLGIIGPLFGSPSASKCWRSPTRFWPGPLTLVLPRGTRIPANVSAGLDTVAVRMPNHPVALALIRQSGVPIAAPSANRFGHVSPTSAQHVLDDLQGRIDVVLDGGPTSIGVESTVLDLSSAAPAILRPGGLTREAIEQVIGSLGARESGSKGAEGESLPGSDTPLHSPGMLSKHYAPRAELRILPDLSALLQERQALAARGLRVGYWYGLLRGMPAPGWTRSSSWERRWPISLATSTPGCARWTTTVQT